MLRLLHPFSAVALIVGIVIGAGIFKTPSLVAALSGDAGWALVLWVAGALITGCRPQRRCRLGAGFVGGRGPDIHRWRALLCRTLHGLSQCWR